MKRYYQIVEEEVEALNNLSSSACKIYLNLKLFMNYDTGECYPSLRTLESITHLTPKTVIKALNELDHANIILACKSNRKTTHYFIKKFSK